ncbi:hypothetical protein C0992_009702 [Termitomyces sp. T32_za158]|nr:hypothetical protein C0992_009702 [Termitomyces sp. T32_za158]
MQGASAESFQQGEIHHRPGSFPAINVGIFHGKGTVRPINIDNSKHAALASGLLNNVDVQRLATFASASFQGWAPGVFQHYHKRLNSLRIHMPGLHRNFSRSIFPAAGFNIGPGVWTYRHRDALNCPFGWCAVQALGQFDHTKGGHLILWDLEMYVEFPTGSLILLPSATISHSKVPVQRGDFRASFTQYCAGGLLRYVDYGF